MSTTNLELDPSAVQNIQDKALGVVFGSAIGDAVGLYTEFLPKSIAQQHEPISFWPGPPTAARIDQHRNRFVLGGWTDDTDHTLLILLSYLHHDGVLLPNDFAARLKSWREQGLRCLNRLPLGLGQTVSLVITKPTYLADPTATAKLVWENTQRHVAPNGSLMRTHILGVLCVGMTQDAAFRTAMEYSLLTHYDPRCVASCVANTGLIRGILRGEVRTVHQLDELLDEAFAWTRHHHPDADDTTLSKDEYARHVSADIPNYDALELDDRTKIGYAYKAFAASIFALRRAISLSESGPVDAASQTQQFYDLMFDLIKQGGDADTNACIAGALLGAWMGYDRLPPCWRDGLQDREWLYSKTVGLLVTLGMREGSYRGSEDADTEFFGGKGELTKEELEKREYDLLEMMLLKDKDAREMFERIEKKKAGVWGRVKSFFE